MCVDQDKISMWGCILAPPSGCFIPYHNFETNPTLAKDVNTTFHYVLIFSEYQYITLYN